MEYRRLGASGLPVSVLSFGAWLTLGREVPRGEARNLVAAAWDHGINFFDNAELYGYGDAERVMGDVIADLRLPRDGYAVSSKAFFGSVKQPLPMQRGLSRKHLHDACHDALKRLRVEYLDLFYCHRHEDVVPMTEIVFAMDSLVRQGKVMYWGTSEWPAERIREAHAVAARHGWVAPVVEQPEYNLLARARMETEYAPLFREFGMGATTWSPLASGLLSGKYDTEVPEDSRLGAPRNAWLRNEIESGGERRLARARAFTAFARSHGLAPAPLAIAWALRNPDVSSVILGASRVPQLLENLGALELGASVADEVFDALARVAR